MAVDKNNSSSEGHAAEQPKPSLAQRLSRSLTRSYSTVTIMASEPSMDWHKLPRVSLSPHTSLTLGGAAGAAMATASVAPIVTVIDLSIVRAQMDPRVGGLRGALRHTARDLWAGRLAWGRPLQLMTFVYGGTYLVANEVQVACTLQGIDYFAPTAAAASAFNIAAIAWKDYWFYAMFTPGGAPKALPLPSYGLMALRDGLTITSSFVFKAQLQEHLERAHGMAHRTADLAASLTVPLAVQFLSTPLHVLAMDLAKRPGASAASRLAAVASGYTSVLAGRLLRIMPAFGLGSYINDVVKESFYLHNGLPYEK
jgi:hypothetical protein